MLGRFKFTTFRYREIRNPLLAQNNVREGDLICLFWGSNIPIIIRQGGERNYFICESRFRLKDVISDHREPLNSHKLLRDKEDIVYLEWNLRESNGRKDLDLENGRMLFYSDYCLLTLGLLIFLD